MSESIFDATESQLTSAQAKITYLGSQLKPVPTVIFSATGYKPRLDLFLEVQPGHEPYQNDQTPYTMQFSVDPSVFRRILLAVKPVVARSAMKSGLDLLAFSVTREVGQKVEGHDFRIGRPGASEFYESLLGALDPTDAQGRTAIMKQFRATYPEGK